jgi:hypothetical protein
MLKEKMSMYTYTQKEKTFKNKKNSFFINLELNPNRYILKEYFKQIESGTKWKV